MFICEDKKTSVLWCIKASVFKCVGAGIRAKCKVEYSIHNVLMSGFAMMFFQDSSML